MPLTPQVLRLLEALEKAAPDYGPCPVCKRVPTRWQPFTDVVALPVADYGDPDDEALDEPTAAAVLAITCSNCGYIRMHKVSELDQHMIPGG